MSKAHSIWEARRALRDGTASTTAIEHFSMRPSDMIRHLFASLTFSGVSSDARGDWGVGTECLELSNSDYQHEIGADEIRGDPTRSQHEPISSESWAMA